MESDKNDEIITRVDFETFKFELIAMLKELLPKASVTTPKKWLKSSDARKLIGVSPGKLQIIRDSGMLPYTKIGGNIYYDQDDLMQLFESNKRIKK